MSATEETAHRIAYIAARGWREDPHYLPYYVKDGVTTDYGCTLHSLEEAYWAERNEDSG